MFFFPTSRPGTHHRTAERKTSRGRASALSGAAILLCRCFLINLRTHTHTHGWSMWPYQQMFMSLKRWDSQQKLSRDTFAGANNTERRATLDKVPANNYSHEQKTSDISFFFFIYFFFTVDPFNMLHWLVKYVLKNTFLFHIFKEYSQTDVKFCLFSTWAAADAENCVNQSLQNGIWLMIDTRSWWSTYSGAQVYFKGRWLCSTSMCALAIIVKIILKQIRNLEMYFTENSATYCSLNRRPCLKCLCT